MKEYQPARTGTKKGTVIIKCLHCNHEFQTKSSFTKRRKFCKQKCENKWKKRDRRYNTKMNPVDPAMNGRVRLSDPRDKSSENRLTLGTAWSIRKKKISKKELLELKKKYEPERY